jgi:hypothetical protein
MKYIIKESQYNLLKENKKKKLFTKLLGDYLIDSIQEVTSSKELPIGFLKHFGTSTIQSYIDAYGPLYYFVLDGENFVYKDRGDYEMYINDKGKSFLDGEITDRLGLSDMGLKFSDVIDIFHNEGEPLNEETDNSEDKQIKFLKKFYDVEVSSEVFGKKITTWVRFIPKDSDDEMTPSIVVSTGEWSIKRDGGLDFEDCTYIRNRSNRMPLLDYMTDYHLNNYVVGLHRSEAKKRVS